MPETRTYQVFKFDELSEEAKQKVLDKYRDILIDESFKYEYLNWYYPVYEQFTEDMEQEGFKVKIDEISFCGFYSQGDGASFGSTIDIEKFISQLGNDDQKKYKQVLKIKDLIDLTYFSDVFHGPGNYLYRSIIWSSDIKESLKRLNKLINDLGRLIDIEYKSACKRLYRSLEKEYESLSSDEYLTEFFNESNYMFTEAGKIE